MKKVIRKNVFETNSSSVHSICISKKKVKPRDFISFHIGEFGWEHDCVSTADYLYTAILYMSEDTEENLEKLKDILDSHNIKYKFEEPVYDKYGLDNGYIDHGYETRDFVNSVLSDEDLLMRYLFGDSWVYTGNDNSYDQYDMCYAADEIVWDNTINQMISNPNHDEEKYDYFFKGN